MEKLVRRAQRGDRDAFVRLIEEHKLSMTRTALAVLHDEEDAADAIGETVLTAFAKLHTLREPKYFKTWLTRVLLCNCFGILRLRRGLAPLDQLPEGAAPEKDRDLALDVGGDPLVPGGKRPAGAHPPLPGRPAGEGDRPDAGGQGEHRKDPAPPGPGAL